MNESLDSLVAEIIKRGWRFRIASGDGELLTSGDNGRFLVFLYHATVTSPRGESSWEADTPLEALSLAYRAVGHG